MPGPPRTSGQRAGLDRGRVLGAARELLADHGVEGVTMRRLATRLGVRPNALYSHVASKAALVEALLDDALAGIPAPDRPDWRDGLRDVLWGTHAVLLDRPDLVPVALAGGSTGPEAQRLGAAMLELLARGGVTGPPAEDALRVLLVHAIGSAAFDAQDARRTRAKRSARFDRGLGWLLAGIAAEAAAPVSDATPR